MRELLLDLFIIGTYFVIIVMPVIEFPWRIMAGTIVTVAVALCFKTGQRLPGDKHPSAC